MRLFVQESSTRVHLEFVGKYLVFQLLILLMSIGLRSNDFAGVPVLHYAWQTGHKDLAILTLQLSLYETFSAVLEQEV